jgi:hypothetical protein
MVKRLADIPYCAVKKSLLNLARFALTMYLPSAVPKLAA